MKGQKENPFSSSVKRVAEDLFPFGLVVKNKHFKEPKDMEGFLISASHTSHHLFLQKAFRTPTLTFPWGGWDPCPGPCHAPTCEIGLFSL